MSYSCSMCGPGAACNNTALMQEPKDWRGRLSGRTWPGPAGGHPFPVGGSKMIDWKWVAAADGWAPWDLIHFNFGTRDPREVNWYLYHFVGCRVSNDGNKNLSFHHSNPGVIFTRNKATPVAPQLPLIPAGPVGPIVKPPVKPEEPAPLFKRGLLWVGFGIQAGGMGIVAGSSHVVAYMMNVEDPGSRFLLTINNIRVGQGVGGSANVVFVVINGLYDPVDVKYAPAMGVDFQAAVGTKWASIGKAARFAPNLHAAVKAARTHSHIEDLGTIAEIVSYSKTTIKMLMIDETSPELDVRVIEVPMAGGGMEAGLFWEESLFRAHKIILSPEPYELE